MASEASWQRISAIFEQALLVPPETRDDWIAQACKGDAELRNEVEKLLAAHDRSTGILDDPLFKVSPSEAIGSQFVLPAGARVGAYNIVSEIGRGGMGVVYEAVDTRLDRTVALKFLYPYLLSNKEIKARFKREAQAAASLNHPNICPVYEIGESDDKVYISMAHVEGKNLEQCVDAGPLKLEQALDIATQTARGLQAAHAKGIVHRDIKPSNIMLGDDGQVTVMDFGLAQLSNRSTLTRGGAVLGTPAYMSPEQARGQPTDPRTDIWSLGVVLYEMLAGHRPFRGEYEQAILYEVVNEDPEPLTAVRSGIPIDVERLVEKALAKRADERYASAEGMLVDLRVLSRKMGDGATTGADRRRSRPSLRQDTRQRRAPIVWAAAAAAALLLAVVGATTTWLWTSSPPADLLTHAKLTRLTRDAGLTATPALSLDGNLVAYASDRGDDDNLDIWMQQVSGGTAVRLTEDPAADHSPVFSPDGKSIAFQSDRNGGGIYVIPTLGGSPRLLVRGGQRPRYSRDGRFVAYYAGPPSSTKGTTVHVVSSDGGAPRALVTDFEVAAMPIWAPDNRHLLFWGNRPGEPLDIWTVPLDGGPAVETGAAKVLGDHGLNPVSLDSWAPEGDYVVFSGIMEDSVNIWRLPVSSRTWRVAGAPQRLTLGSDEREASVAPGGRIVFTNSVRRINIWRLPLHVNSGSEPRVLERITAGAAADYSPDVTLDGARVSFRSTRSGNIDAWVTDTQTLRETPLTRNTAAESAPRLNYDGSQAAFSVVEGAQRPIYTVNATSGLTARICDHCGPPHGWTTDSAHIVYQHVELQKSAIHLLDVATGEHAPLAQHPEFPLFAARLSLNDQWLAFKGDVATNRAKIFVARMPAPPAVPQTPIPVEEWVSISSGDTWDDLPRWSPDGKLIYFTSDRDGFRCIWARAFDPAAGRPSGEPFAVQHLHRLRLSLSSLSLSELELAVSRSALYFPLAEVTGNVWLAEPRESQ
jgi:serine/threonine protein kinase/Tol biopolymer transport system component